MTAPIDTYVQCWSEGDLAGVGDHFSPRLENTSLFGQSGRARTLELIGIYQRHFEPELVIDQVVSSGHRSCLTWRETGRAIGPFNGKPGSGQSYRGWVSEWLEWKSGRIRKRWIVRNTHFNLTQAGW
jgi:hypothetical protein